MERNSWIKESIVILRYDIISFSRSPGDFISAVCAFPSLGRDDGMPRKRFSFFKQLAGVGCAVVFDYILSPGADTQCRPDLGRRVSG